MAAQAARPSHAGTITIRSNIAKLDMDRGHYDEAEKMLRPTRYQEPRSASAASTTPITLTLEHNLAYAIENNGNKEEAMKLWRDVVERRERVLGPMHPFTLASMNNLASLLDRTGEIEEAEKMGRTVLERREEALGEKSLDTMVSINNLGLQLLEPADTRRGLAGAPLPAGRGLELAQEKGVLAKGRSRRIPEQPGQLPGPGGQAGRGRAPHQRGLGRTRSPASARTTPTPKGQGRTSMNARKPCPSNPRGNPPPVPPAGPTPATAHR